MTREERREAIEYLKKYRELDERLYQTAPFTSVSHNALVKCLRHWDNAIQALEQEPRYCDRNICTKNEYNGIGCDECEVTKSQDPTDENLHREQAYMQGYEDACKKYRQVPKTGHWLYYGRLLKCSNCGYIHDNILDDCPNCRAKMD